MSEKMTTEKAHDILFRHSSEQNQECHCHSCDKAEGFIEGHESRNGEVEELNKKITEWETFKTEYKKFAGSILWPEESK